jgi:Photoprotection regulator fluorescence recovery protein
MHDREWSAAEKEIARRAFEAALDTALAEIMTEFKAKTAAAVTPEDMWSVERFLRQRRREIEETFDYRYSQLPVVFGRLILEEYLDEGRLTGLSQDKLEEIRRYVSLVRRS